MRNLGVSKEAFYAMRMMVEVAMDRMPDELVARFIGPLDALLRDEGLGRVVGHNARETLSLDVRLNVRGTAGFERTLQFLFENDAPIGTVAYRLNWLGQKKDIAVLGPEC